MRIHTAASHRRYLLAFVALFAAAALLSAQGGLSLRGTKGETLREADLAQGVTVMVFWASWSPRGKDVVNRVNSIAGRWGDRASVVTVNFQEDRATIDEFLAGKSLRVPVFMDQDGAFSKKYAVTTLPSLLVFKNGEAAFRGRLPDDPDRVLREILG